MAGTKEDGLPKRIEIGANVAIIIVALVAVVMLARNYWAGPAALHHSINPGTKFALKAANWQAGSKTIVLALSTNCRFCTESAGFYRELALQCRQQHIHTIAVLPQSTAEAQSYLENGGITVDEVRHVDLSELQVNSTPTLLMIDGTGVVKRVWFGKLPSDQEREVLAQIIL